MPDLTVAARALASLDLVGVAAWVMLVEYRRWLREVGR